MRPSPIRLLCVEGNPHDVELMGLSLARVDPARHFELERVETAADFGAALGREWDAVLCDYHLPHFSPHAALQTLAERQSTLPLIVVSRAIGEDAAVDILRCGASDYVSKDRLATLPQRIDRVLAERRRRFEEARLGAGLQVAHTRLRALSAHLLIAQERERERIARELHDQIGQELTALVVHLHAAERAPSPEVSRQHQATALQLAHGAIRQLKTLSFELRPPQLDLLGLAAALRSAAERLLDPAGVALLFTVRGHEPERLHPQALPAFRLVLGAITHTVRHAQASCVVIRLRYPRDGRLGVLVLDDGIGFDRRRVLGDAPSERDIGLHGMVERAELAGARLSLRARAGVALRAVFPAGSA